MDSLFHASSMATDDAGPVDGGVVPPRQPPRESLLLTARLWLHGDHCDREVRMRNLSPGGVMVDCSAVREPGSLVRLEMPGLRTVAGKVAWCTAGRMGIAFESPIDPALVRIGAAVD
ncbi:PilZ domain-containing protein [Arthrobacter sp. TPD3018]|uniref:PilZ domain-containing protein n=1 Tax=Bacteria TaxID=2 RepID=UPI000D52472E|nr:MULTISPECIES: PilZ domain-containing protein [Bacteria]PVE59950.1 PilZ domain-containing protein [Sphingomonas sp. TPD3009]PVE61466.1 PilZ domain-containing protein [Arthrobacter sp. TPD3018]PVE85617.1 PilZ domain-containing protein [Sphingomonas melonis]